MNNNEQSPTVVYGVFCDVPYEGSSLVGIYLSEEAAETARLEWRTNHTTRVLRLQVGLPADICFIYAS